MFKHGSFRNHPGKIQSTGIKGPATDHKIEHGPAQAAHGDEGEKHVTETHPGQTQPHPVTGVHAFHAHHTGGGKYKSYTHHDGGDVETRDHSGEHEVKHAHDEAFPSEGGESSQGGGMDADSDMGEALSGVGGGESY